MKKSLGSKRKEISTDQTESLIQSYKNFEENEFSKIFDNEFFGYTKVTIEQPLIEDEKVVTKKDGKPKPNTSLRDSERIPLNEDIEEYYNREVKPHLPNSWMDREKDKVGYEINFTKYFYHYKPLRSLVDITSDLLELEKESEGIFKEIVNE
jgi:type I restriction enzyme M protein